MTKNEMYQAAFDQFQEEHGYMPSGTRIATEWAAKKGLIPIPKIDPLDIASQEMSDALRAKNITDVDGRKYRKYQAVRYTVKGAQHTMWGIEGFVDPSHSIESFAQRREQIISDCHHLKTDVDVHNEKHQAEHWYSLELDFTEDVAEREMVDRPSRRVA